jgi:hypothetical protein
VLALKIVGAVRAEKVVTLEKGRRRKDDIGELRRVGHELLVNDGEEVAPEKAPAHEVESRLRRERIAAGDEEHRHRGVLQGERVCERVDLAGACRRRRGIESRDRVVGVPGEGPRRDRMRRMR